VRSAPLIRARGRLERREGIVNVLVEDLRGLELPPRRRGEPRRQPGAAARAMS
jgi:hypothetical protein